jgi:hypothetical protein
MAHMYKLYIVKNAEIDIDGIYEYVSQYDLSIAKFHLDRLEDILMSLKQGLVDWNYFFLTGEPYKAKLFRISSRRTYWIIYRIHPRKKVIYILRVWGCFQNPKNFKI